MKHSMIVRDLVAVFPASAAKYPAIDRIVLTLYLEGQYRCEKLPCVDVAQLRSGESLGIARSLDPKLRWLPGTRVPFLSWHDDGLTVNQKLGGYGGHRRSARISQTVIFNPISETARMLRGSSAVGEEHSVPKRNFVHPSTMSVRQLHKATVEIVMARRAQCISDYIRVLQSIFGFRVPEDSVRCSVSLIALAWDVPCAIPALALRGLHAPWLRGLPDAKLVVRSKKSCMDWEYSAWSDGTLRAKHSQGYSSKVYASNRDALRFEAQLHANGQRRLLSRRVQITDENVFRSDVRELGRATYATIYDVQQELTATRVMPIENALCAGVDPRRKPIFRQILSELMSMGRVHTRDRARYAVLCGLRDAGCVRVSKPKGCWEATPAYARALRCFMRFAQVYSS